MPISQVKKLKTVNKPVLHIDMDDTLCDFTSAWNMVKQKQPEVVYPQSTKGFFFNLAPIEDAIDTVNELRQLFDVYILTAPSYKNPLCYTEKRLWVEKHFDLEFTKQLIICAHKNLLIGDFLVDDYLSGKGQENFAGKLIHFGSEEFPNWSAVKDSLLRNL